MKKKKPFLLMNCTSLKNKEIVLAVTGGIAAYKSAEIIRRLRTEGASLTVLMTEASSRFITPLTLEVLSSRKVYRDIFEDPLSHLQITKDADIFLIAPATANMISKIASGMGDDIVSLSVLAYKDRILFAPSMNWRMYENPAVKNNIEILKKRGFYEIPPESGSLACGEEGRGRMASVDTIVDCIKDVLHSKDMVGMKVLVTAGPTREYLDPVRFISNPSTGKMGIALARVAKWRGAEVVLIIGAGLEGNINGIDTVWVETTEEMYKNVKEYFRWADLLVMAAAPSDFSPKVKHNTKLEKERVSSIEMKPARDILTTIKRYKGRRKIIGFSADTGLNIAKLRRKMTKKGMDILVFNDVTLKGVGFGYDTNRIYIMDKKEVREFHLMSKEECAEAIYNHFMSYQVDKKCQ